MDDMTIHEPTPEEKDEYAKLLEICSSSATMFGNTLHFYGRSILHVTFNGDTELGMRNDTAEPEPDDLEETEPDINPDDLEGTEEDIDLFHSPAQGEPRKLSENSDPVFQLAQIFTLLHPDMKQFLGESSAIYQLFHNALHLRGLEGETIEQQINGADRHLVIVTWILTKNVFALRHYGELFVILEALSEALHYRKLPSPLQLSAMSDKELTWLSELCDTLNRRYKTAAPAEENAESLRTITEIMATGNLILPTSKAFREQMAIAAMPGVADLAVGNGAVVYAKITGADGKPTIQLSKFEMDIEATVGQIFHEEGFHEITITPAQIYRKYSGMGASEKVSDESIQKTIAAMDKLLTTPATLDFTQQIEKHTKLKKNPHFDYENRVRKGTLITGVHDKKRSTAYRGTTVEDSFTIYAMPMLYAYSYAIHQLATVPVNLLTGEPAKPKNEKKVRQKKAVRSVRLSSEEVGLRRYLLGQIEYHKDLREKRDRKLQYAKKNVPKTYEGIILFSTIAEDIRFDVSTPKRLRMLREQVYSFMQQQVELKSIKAVGYHLNGKAYAGVKITL